MTNSKDKPGAVIWLQLPSRWFCLNEVNWVKGKGCGHPARTLSDFWFPVSVFGLLGRVTLVDLLKLMTAVPASSSIVKR